MELLVIFVMAVFGIPAVIVLLEHVYRTWKRRAEFERSQADIDTEIIQAQPASEAESNDCTDAAQEGED